MPVTRFPLGNSASASRRTEFPIPGMDRRTPEQAAADRARIFANSAEPRALPPGTLLEDMVVGQRPSDETDEEISAALEELSWRELAACDHARLQPPKNCLAAGNG